MTRGSRQVVGTVGEKHTLLIATIVDLGIFTAMCGGSLWKEEGRTWFDTTFLDLAYSSYFFPQAPYPRMITASKIRSHRLSTFLPIWFSMAIPDQNCSGVR